MTDAAAGTILGIVNVVIFVIGATAVIMIIIGGVRYVVSGGDSGAISSAKNTILYAVVGIVVAIMAYALINFVLASFTADETQPQEKSDTTAFWSGLGISVALSLSLAALRRTSRVYRGIVYGTVWLAARFHPAGNRREFQDRIRGTILQAGPWERWIYLQDIILHGPALGLRRRATTIPPKMDYRP
ncbi:pilin [Verrucosispora sp. WMMD573]|uniref:pilin n=1 Tax=Verrucosispora sp. WMMD573 TaxID=3015149 RepID=UPI00248CF92B|nr:pilin [Verrucosispora sp. WMMD573]WBB52399.1 pilin [Verrucosispora sp. WMMD573]